MKPGFYPDMSEAQYHSDPCAVPSLSSSIAKTIIDDSLKHAWLAHPQLNPNIEQTEPTREMEIGTVTHKLILGSGRDALVIDTDAYTTNAAKEQRAQAYAQGSSPILRPDLEKSEAIAKALGLT